MMGKKLRFVIFVMCCFSLQAQQLCNDLTAQLKGKKDSTVLVLVDRIYEQEIAKKTKNILLIKLWKFAIYDSLGYTSLKEKICADLLPVVEKIEHPYASKICLSAGGLEISHNEFLKGISIYHRGLKIAQKCKDQENTCKLLKAIGIAYLHLDDYSTAEKHLRIALGIASKYHMDLQVANVSISLGNALKEQKDFTNAIKYYEKSLQIARKLNNQRLIAGNFNNLGNAMRNLKKNERALEYFKKALEINILSNNLLWQSYNYHNIGNVYSDLGRPTLAITYFLKANNIKRELGESLSLKTGYEALSIAYSMLNDFGNAYSYLKKFIKIKDSLNVLEQANLLKDLEVKYEAEKKQTEIERLHMSADLQKLKNDSLSMQNQKNRNISVLSIFAALSLLIGVGVLWKTNRKRREINTVLNLKNKEIELANTSLQHALDELSVKNQEVIDSINYATYIQQAALPNISQLSTDRLQFELFFAPKDIVSGDFYFSYQLYNRSVFGVADCTGHGVPGAMVSLVGMNSLDKVVREEKLSSTALMLESLNEHFKRSLQRGGESINDGMDISLCGIDHGEKMIHFSGAHHTAFIIRKNRRGLVEEDDFISIKTANTDFSLIQMKGVRRPIGESISKDPFRQVSCKLVEGDRVVLFSDGFADQVGGEAIKKLKKGVLLSLLLESSHLLVKDQVLFMKSGFENWRGENDQVDDVCLLIVEVL
jgi:serine phosphatase RsbU (regulator of sigma subunit)